MTKEQQPKEINAFSIFPDLFKQSEGVEKTILKENEPEVKKVVQDRQKSRLRALKSGVTPPPPPDLNWLMNNNQGSLEHDSQEDRPAALVLTNDTIFGEYISSSLKDLSYHVESAKTASEAILKLSSFDYSTVAMQTTFEKGGSLKASKVHNYVTWLPMDRRRHIFYVLIGQNFHTLYNLEALTISANLVVNEADLQYLSVILRKSFRAHEELFGPLLQAMEEKW